MEKWRPKIIGTCKLTRWRTDASEWIGAEGREWAEITIEKERGTGKAN